MANYKVIIPFIRKVEGGLSKAKTDSASKNPVPDGSGYHTNKGITWTTFVALAPKAGFKPTPDLFYKMPDPVWEGIFKVGFWDAVKGDQLKSQAFADTLVDFAWGAGPGSAIRELQYFLKIKPTYVMDAQTLKLVNQMNENVLHKGFSDFKLNYYETLPGQSANYDAWKKRLNALYALTAKYVVSKPAAIGGSVVLALCVGYGLYRIFN